MRFLIDECAGPGLARWLVGNGHDVFSVFDQARGANDEELLIYANREDRIVIPADKDFGEMVFRSRMTHRGIVLMRLDDERSANKIVVIAQLLQRYGDRLPGAFVVVSEDRIRFART